MRLRRRLRALGDVVAAQWALLVVTARMRLRPAGDLVDPVTEESAEEATPAEVLRAMQLAAAVRRASRWGPLRPSCLARALALQALLRSNGVRTERVRVGVRWDGRGFAAHAWVEVGSHVLDDTAGHVETFTRMANVRSARR
jgi:hypothetical protein